MEELMKMLPKKIFKTLEDMERSKINYTKLVYKSGDNKYFDFNKFGPPSIFYLRLMNRDIDIDVAKLNMEEFKKEINMLEKKKTKKEPYKKNKEGVLKNPNALYKGLDIIVDAFEKYLSIETVLKSM